jgi:hypothetical protein
MSSQSSYPYDSLAAHVLRSTDTDRLKKAVTQPFDVTITFTTEREIRALVKNADAREYGVVLSATTALCSCPDSLYRARTCKHQAAVAFFVLRNGASTVQKPEPRTIHLLKDGAALCGVVDPAHFWRHPYWPEINWHETCPDCEHVRRRPVRRSEWDVRMGADNGQF